MVLIFFGHFPDLKSFRTRLKKLHVSKQVGAKNSLLDVVTLSHHHQTEAINMMPFQSNFSFKLLQPLAVTVQTCLQIRLTVCAKNH